MGTCLAKCCFDGKSDKSTNANGDKNEIVIDVMFFTGPFKF